MDIKTTLSRVPRWAWITSGGVAIGIVGFRVIEARRANASDTAATAAGDAGQTDQNMPQDSASSTGNTSVLVPPVVVGNTDGSEVGSSVIGGITDLFGLIVPSLTGAVQTGADIESEGVQTGQDSVTKAAEALTTLTGGGPPSTIIRPTQPQPAAKPPVTGYNYWNPKAKKWYKKVEVRKNRTVKHGKKTVTECWLLEQNVYTDGSKTDDHWIRKVKAGKC